MMFKQGNGVIRLSHPLPKVWDFRAINPSPVQSLKRAM